MMLRAAASRRWASMRNIYSPKRMVPQGTLASRHNTWAFDLLFLDRKQHEDMKTKGTLEVATLTSRVTLTWERWYRPGPD